MNFFEKSLITLELPAVLKMLASCCVCETAKENALLLSPYTEKSQVISAQQETDAAKQLSVLRGSPAFLSIKDIRPSLSRADLGGTLNNRELLEIARVLQSAAAVKGYIAEASDAKTCIDHLFSALRSNKFLENKISSSLIGDDEVADSASSELSNIRRQMRITSSRIRDTLQKIVSSPTYQKVLQEPIITTRSDRYVVPVRAEFKGAIPGLVHDISSSGATLFIEPMSVLNANNELRELAAREKAEIERILAELSADCAEHKDDIESDYVLLVRLDLIFAKAKLSYQIDGVSPLISEKEIVLKRARHPLLSKDTVVPIDLELGKDFDTLVITGPNTGGKTVTLKTLGLLAAMAQCGLHIPASDGSCLPVFTHILADIGDEQSIEQSLSTFSAHMRNIVNILSECDEDSLLLFDELGAGTDPTEGAALATAIIQKARDLGATVAATTHYAELKVFAMNEKGVQNASCEFDVETLQPTYRLLIGIPGKSNAFAISRKLGLDEDIIESARAYINSENSGLESSIEALDSLRVGLERKNEEAEQLLANAREDREAAEKYKAEYEQRFGKAERAAKREAERIISDARQTAESVFAELDDMKRRINEEENIQAVNKARSELLASLNRKEESYAEAPAYREARRSSRPVAVGDMVEVTTLGLKGEVSEISPTRELTVVSGAMTFKAKEEDCFLLEDVSAKNKKAKLSTGATLRTDAKKEIDLRGMESVEAVFTAEQFLDSAVMSKLKTVTIIHGKGTGALRTAIHRMLRSNRSVRSFRLGNYGEGETGVTIVELK